MQSAYAVDKKTSATLCAKSPKKPGAGVSALAPFNWGRPDSNCIATAVASNYVRPYTTKAVPPVSRFQNNEVFFSLRFQYLIDYFPNHFKSGLIIINRR